MSENPEYRVVVVTASIGMFLSTLDTGIINVALPTLGQQFNVSIPFISLAVSLYLAALSATILLFGRLSDSYGRIKFYSAGLIVFGIGSLLSGFAPSALIFVSSRFVQGIGAAMMQGIAAALITTLVAPERRGTALGTMGIMIGLGPALGPPVGGFLISAIGWRWIFWINVPICLIGLWGCNRLRHSAQRAEPKSGNTDITGNFLFTAGILVLIIGLSQIRSGNTDLTTLAVPGAGIVLLVLFVLWERRAPNPVMDLGLFHSSAFTVPLIGTAAFGAAAAISFLAPPYFLENVLTLMPWQVGLVTLFSPLGLLLLSQISGSSINRFGSSKLMLIGLLGMFVGFAGLSLIQRGWSVIPIAVFLFIFGVGGGIFQPPNIDAIMGTVSAERQGEISSMQRMVQNLFIAIGAALSATLIGNNGTNLSKLIDGIQQSWILGAAILLVSLAIFAFVIASDGFAIVESTTTAKDD